MSTECLSIGPMSSQEYVCVLSSIIPLHTLQHILPPRLPIFIRSSSSLHNVRLDLALSSLHTCVDRGQSRHIRDSTVHRCLRVTLTRLTFDKRYTRFTLQIMHIITLFSRAITMSTSYAFILQPLTGFSLWYLQLVRSNWLPQVIDVLSVRSALPDFASITLFPQMQHHSSITR